MSDSKSIIDQGLIRELANLLTETGLTEIEGDTVSNQLHRLIYCQRRRRYPDRRYLCRSQELV